MRLLAFTAAMLVTGCAMPLSSFETTRTTAISTVGSERTYRNVLGAIRTCYPALYSIESAYFPEAREGEITLAYAFEYGRTEYFKATISPAGDRADVTMVRRSNLPALDDAMRAWVTGAEGGCPYGTKYEARAPGSTTNHNNAPTR